MSEFYYTFLFRRYKLLFIYHKTHEDRTLWVALCWFVLKLVLNLFICIAKVVLSWYSGTNIFWVDIIINQKNIGISTIGNHNNQKVSAISVSAKTNVVRALNNTGNKLQITDNTITDNAITYNTIADDAITDNTITDNTIIQCNTDDTTADTDNTIIENKITDNAITDN